MLTGGTPPAAAGTVGTQGGATSTTTNNGNNRAGQGTEAARARRGRRGWERRSQASSADVGARSGKNNGNADDGAGVGASSSLAAQVLASAAQTAAPLEESHGGWCDTSVDGGACDVGGVEGENHAVNCVTTEDEFEFLAEKSGGDEASDGPKAV